MQWSHVRVLKDDRGAVAFYLMSFSDMTPIKNAEAALIQSEKFLRDAQAIAKIGSWELDPITHEVIWSSHLYDIYGLPKTLRPGEIWAEVQKMLAPADLDRVKKIMATARDEGTMLPFEHPITLPDGRVRYLAISGEPGRSADGKSTVFRGICQDITERRVGEEEKKISHEAIAAVSQGVIITDGEGRTVRVNQAFLRITGYAEDEVLGRNCRFLQGAGTNAETVQAIRSAVETGKNFSGEILNYRKDGSEFWNDLSITPILGADGKPAHFIGILRDVSDRMRLDDLLHRRQHEHLHLINSLPGPVARINQNLEYEFLNDKYVSVFGRSRYDSIGHSIEEVSGELAFVLQKPLFLEAMAGKVVEYETRLVDCAGNQKIWLVTLIP
ncbi:MAG: PAS domain S-box protein, partial [Spirochaetia bacterium]|nr:PAS domain S-box protein [Spirochaetia bacterium]